MNHDDEIEGASRREPDDEPVESGAPMTLSPRENVVRPELPSRPRTGMGAWQPPADPLPPLRPPSGSLARNVPSHPSWEKPPSPYNYPRLRGQEKRQSMKPLLFAALGVVVILGAVVLVPALTGRKGSAPAVSGSPSPDAIVSTQPLLSAAPSQSGNGGTPVPLASYQQYKVQAGDSVAKIATKFHLQRWELLLANPQIVGPAYAVLVNRYVNIPLPGTLTQPPAEPTDSPTPSSGATLLAP